MSSEQEDWHFIEKETGPGHENKTPSLSFSEGSDTNLQFMEASITQSCFRNDMMAPPLTTPKINLLGEDDADNGTEDTIGNVSSADSALLTFQREYTENIRTFQPPVSRQHQSPHSQKKMSDEAKGCIAMALFSIVFTIFLAYLKSNARTHAPPNPRNLSAIGRLEEQALSASHQLAHHGQLLASLETQITRLTELVSKSSSCGAHFYENDPRFDLSKAVKGRQGVFSEGLFVEGRTKVCPHLGNNNKELVQVFSPQQCTYNTEIDDDAEVIRENEAPAEKQIRTTDFSKKGDGNNENRNNNIDRDSKLFVDKVNNELQDRIAALEHGMTAIHSLLSSSNDDVDRELATLSSTLARLQEKVEDLEFLI